METYSEFKKTVWDFYETHGRDLPWRQTTDPYSILVSEIMLQQTQVGRVIPKYNDWLEKFPDFPSLADAPLSKVLALWKGLGYNRRAKFLKQTAEQVVEEYGGTLPEDEDKLLDLPGIGPYTARALQAFVWNKPVVLIETNVRTVYLFHFFEDEKEIGDEEIKKLVKETFPWNNQRASPAEALSDINWEERRREWYWALMDYGSFLKSEHGNPNKKSKSYQTQSKFEGSNRQLRSELLDFILNNQPVSAEEIEDSITAETDRQKSVEENLDDLEKEGFIEKTSEDKYQVAE